MSADAAAFAHDGAGTPESAWQRWPGLRDLPPVDPAEGTAHVLLVAAHPDDETLGAGGLLARLGAAGVPADVVVATGGEASHPHSPTTSPAELARVRAAEVEHAVALLHPGARVHHLGLPDGALGGHVDALREALVALLRPGSLVVAPWPGDGHPDHDAAGLAAARAAGPGGHRTWHYPVWAWHWARPGDARLPWGQGVRVDLDDAVRARKRAALAAHTSQTAPLSPRPGDEVLLAPGVLAHFDRAAEVFWPGGASAGPTSLDAGFFDAFYARHDEDPWGFGERWYERRKRAVTWASLPRERFRSALEVGCSAGVATRELAQRCDALLAVDASATVVQRAREGLADLAHVRLARAAVPAGWPDGTFDLVLLAEVAYYCGPDDLDDLLVRATGSLTPDGVLLACHWRHVAPDHPLTGDEVHHRVRRLPGWEVLATHEEEDFLLDVLVRAPATSVARADGLLA